MPNFLKGIIHLTFLALPIIIVENLKLASQQCRAWSDCMDVQAGLTLYWWRRLIIFGVGRIRVNFSPDKFSLLCLILKPSLLKLLIISLRVSVVVYILYLECKSGNIVQAATGFWTKSESLFNYLCHQYRAFTSVQSDQALHWWQRLISVSVGRIRVKLSSYWFKCAWNFHAL